VSLGTLTLSNTKLASKINSKYPALGPPQSFPTLDIFSQTNLCQRFFTLNQSSASFFSSKKIKMRKLKVKVLLPFLAFGLVQAQGNTRYIESNKYAAADEFFREDNWNDYAGLWIEHNDFLVSIKIRINQKLVYSRYSFRILLFKKIQKLNLKICRKNKKSS